MKRTVGQRIRYLREKRGLKQEELAKQIDINNSVLSRIESDKRPLRTDELKKLSEFFEVSADYISGTEQQKDAVDKLIEYLDLELTDEEIMERMTFKVDNLTLTPDEVKEFIAFVRAKRFMKSGQVDSSRFDKP